MPGLRFFRAQRPVVELLGFLEALEGQTLRRKTRGRHEARALAQPPLETRPVLLVKFCSHAQGGLGEVLFVGFERCQQLRAQRIILGAELLNPFLHYLGVAEVAERSKHPAGHFAHFGPRRVGVDLLHHSRQGAAAANGNAEVVDGVGIRGGLQTPKLFQNAIHPVGETPVFGLRPTYRGNCKG